MRYLVMSLLLAGCASGAQMQSGSAGREYTTVEYFNSGFDRVVDATYAAVSSMGMYVEDRYRSGMDQVISVQAVSMGTAASLLITVSQPTVQGVAVSISSESRSLDQLSLENEAQSIFRNISLRLGF